MEVTLFDPAATLDPDTLERACQRGRCEIVERGDGWALVLNHRDRQSNGTPVIEAATGGRATSRGLSTILGLSR